MFRLKQIKKANKITPILLMYNRINCITQRFFFNPNNPMGAKKADNDNDYVNVNDNDNDYNSNSNELLCETSQTHDETINLTSFVVFFN